VKGTCQCGRIELEVQAVRPVGVNCYCTICRKITGGPFSTTVMVEEADFRIVRGADALSRYSATPGVDRFHCAHCHAPIYSHESARPQWGIFVAAGLFDGADLAHVVFDHVFVESLVPWYQIRDQRPQFARLP